MPFDPPAASYQEAYLTPLFDDSYVPRARLLRLLEILGMGPLTGIVEINEWAQKNLLRHGERWEQQTERFEALKPLLMPLLEEAGFVHARYPQFKKYQGALVLGALLPRVRLRLEYLVTQWEQGIRFSDLYFLGSERPLEPLYENTTTLAQELPKTECEMMRFVWERSEIPEAMRRQVSVHFINAPMKKDPRSQKLLRPTMDDTVEIWLKGSPPEGRYLMVSNAPYTVRQDLVARTIAPKEYRFDSIGPAADDQLPMAIFLDELARLIFQTLTLSRPPS